jgi:hypothetical protein
MMITTLLDLLGALLVILAVAVLVGTYAPLWAAFLAAGVLTMVFSFVLAKIGGVK